MNIPLRDAMTAEGLCTAEGRIQYSGAFLPIASDGLPVNPNVWPQDVQQRDRDGALFVTVTSPAGRRYQQSITLDRDGMPDTMSDWIAL